MTTAREIIEYMESQQNEVQRRNLMRFFKTGPGEYGEGDEFLGLKVPQTREIVRAVAREFPLDEVPELLMSKWHEVRLCGLLILVAHFERLSTKRLVNDAEAIRGRDEIVRMYLEYAERANNWNLVDLSAPKILGGWLLLPSNMGARNYKQQVLDGLACSDPQPPKLGGSGLWRQRMSMVCTWKPSHEGDPSWCLRYAEIHLHHPHDLMHKAVGWMLREMGKHCSMDLLRVFLRQHAHEMPRTTLRYAIEKMSEAERKEWMSMDAGSKMPEVRSARLRISPFAGVAVADFVDIVLSVDKARKYGSTADEAMYYLLHQRLNRQLRERYEVCHRQLWDDFDDILEDFFLYLREGRDGQNLFPYQSLQRIKKKDSFETWLLNTFKNYLNNRAKAELGDASVSLEHGFLDKTDDKTARNELHGLSYSEHESQTPHSSLTDEQKLAVASQLIAYAHQVFYPRGRFIFLRSLLTMLNKQKALPDKEMATALGMTHLSYRVMAHRMKHNLAKFRLRLLHGESLRLDEQHQQMARRINDDFTHLYPTLLTYYTETIASLKCADAIRQLRQEYYEQTGLMAHEPEPLGAVITTPAGFWEKLNRMLVY